MSWILKLLILFLTLLFSLQTAHALAVAQPMPSNVTLKRGESMPIRFGIQAVISRENQVCTFSVNSLDPLKIVFEEEKVLVEAGKKLILYGTLEVPWHAPPKEYEGELTVTCRPDIEAKGVSLITQSSRFPFYVRVERSEERLNWRFFSILVFIGIISVSLVLFKSKYGLKLRRKIK